MQNTTFKKNNEFIVNIFDYDLVIQPITMGHIDNLEGSTKHP